MPGDPYYRSLHWSRLRRTVLDRDGHTCVVPGCRQKATFVDHIVSRRNGGSDALGNLRSLCVEHDGQIKELRTGKRRGDGKLVVGGTDRRGIPIDPNHFWNRAVK